MTTIVYDHNARQIACDSLTTADDIIMSSSFKKYRIRPDGSIWFFCGSVADVDAFIKCIESNEKTDMNLQCNAFIVRGGDVLLSGIDGGEPWTQKIDLNRAIGTGHHFALASLDFGKSAKDAVKYAATRDVYTGGIIRVYDIKTGKFI